MPGPGGAHPQQEVSKLSQLLVLINDATPFKHAAVKTLCHGFCYNKAVNIKDSPDTADKPLLADGDTEPAASVRGSSLRWPLPHVPQGETQKHQQQCTEAENLEQFSLAYQDERHFSRHPHHDHFTQIFQSLVQQRLCNTEWLENAPPENILRVLICLRIMLRDHAYQQMFYQLRGVHMLSEYLQKATGSYLTYGDGPFVVDILKEMTNIFQKLSAVVSQREWLVACGAHKALVLLLSANDVVVLHCTMHSLISLAQSPEPRALIAELNSIEVLLRILQDYDMLSKKLAATLLRLLCGDSQAREMVKVYDGIPLLLSLLHTESIKLLWNIVWCLVQLAEDEESSNDVRQLGGIPMLLSLLHERTFLSDRSMTSSGGMPPIRSPAVEETEVKEHQLSLKSACCACLTELVVNDNNAQHIVQANGIHSLALLIFPQHMSCERDRRAYHTLQANAFRTLRFLFSMERNRRLFKRLFPPDLFEMFIDIGHYKRDIAAYRPLVEKINSLEEDVLSEIKDNLETINQNKAATHHIGDYAVLELLGSGAFGSVYKVRKKTAGQSFLAMKEINTMNPSWGKNSKERQKSIGDVISELTIIREQLKHPNVVRYHKTFIELDKLYIVMELIEGAPLGEHFTSLREKRERFSEDRIWRIFIQMVLALRYLHKEKGIVHRDLTPNNIMLGENDKVTITDFGLAKQKQKDCSKMTSVVGTILYSCPELLQSKPYGEKADVWGIGCILYQMCTLNPPFYSNNMLTLATKIVKAEFDPIPPGSYSDRVVDTIRKCITADPSERPDIIGVAACIADKMLLHMDSLNRQHALLEKKLDKERRKTQMHFSEAQRDAQKYHKLYLVSQERYDKLVNLASSGGGSSIKDETELTEAMFSEQDKTRQFPANSGSTVELTESQQENGWNSEEEVIYNSSGSETRDSSAGPVGQGSAGQGSGVVPRPPGQANPRGRRGRPRHSDMYSQLTLDIPYKYSVSRDSGLSSGDPSPNNVNMSPPSSSVSVEGVPRSVAGMTRSASTPSSSMDSMARRALSTSKARPASATQGTLSISPRRVRQISDPILQMLHQLHKIIYITQLPPTLCHNPRRKVIERFKRVLFAPQSTSYNLKNELRKLITGCREVIDQNFGPSESPKLAKQVSLEQEALAAQSDNSSSLGVFDTDPGEVGITYEQMQSIIEHVLVDSGYYDMSPMSHHRTLPAHLMANPDPFGLQNLKFS